MKIEFTGRFGRTDHDPSWWWDKYFSLPLKSTALVSFWWKPDPWFGFDLDTNVKGFSFSIVLPFFEMTIWRN